MQTNKESTKIPWWIGLISELDPTSREIAEHEIRRFSEKFGIENEQLDIFLTRKPPYVNISSKVEINMEVCGLQFITKLMVYNCMPFYLNLKKPVNIDEFPSIYRELALILSEVFSGEIIAVFSTGMSWKILGVKSENDFIEVCIIPLSEDDEY